MNIYKYLSLENTEKILKYQTLRFTSPLDFNDPFELKPHINKVIINDENELLESFSNYLNSTDQAHKFYEVNINRLMKNIGILCLSSTNDNLTMWAHYADEHKGIVIEFDIKHCFFTKPEFIDNIDLLYPLKKVIYKNKRLSLDSESWISEETFLTKSKHWKYENEYRMSVYFDTDKPEYNIKFPNNLIKSIYLGARTTKDDVKRINNLIKQDKWKHIKVYKFDIDEKEFKLNPKKI